MLTPGLRQSPGGQSVLDLRTAGSLFYIEVRDLTNRNSMRLPLDRNDGIAGLEDALLKDPEVKSGPAAMKKALDDVVALKFCREFETGQAWLRDLEHGRADSQLIPDTEALFVQTFDGQVLAKCSPWQVLAKFLLPERIVLGRIGINGLVHPAMDRQIRLAIAVEIQGADPHRSGYWRFEYSRRHHPVADWHFPG